LGAVEILPTGEVVTSENVPDLQETAEAATSLQQRCWSELSLSRLEIMRGYAETQDCRRRYLLTYFGEATMDPCGFCDTCEAGLPAERQEVPELFPRKSWVTHNACGKALVISYEEDKVTILFDEAGYKTLAVRYAIDQGLLEPLN
jgi:ATP-dependent DNA helicase RecQ